MTDSRYFALTVLLDREIREDDAQPIIEAIKMVRGVMEVQPHISNIELGWALQKARVELRSKISNILWSRDLVPDGDYYGIKGTT